MFLMAILFSIVSLGVSPIQAESPADVAVAAIIIAGHDWNKVHKNRRLQQQRNRQRRQRQMRENQRRRYYRERNRRQTRRLGRDLHHASHHGGGCFISTVSGDE